MMLWRLETKNEDENRPGMERKWEEKEKESVKGWFRRKLLTLPRSFVCMYMYQKTGRKSEFDKWLQWRLLCMEKGRLQKKKKKRIKPKRWKRRRGEDRAMANSEFVRNGRASRIKNFLASVNFLFSPDGFTLHICCFLRS